MDTVRDWLSVLMDNYKVCFYNPIHYITMISQKDCRLVQTVSFALIIR